MTEAGQRYKGPEIAVIGWDAGTFSWIDPLLARRQLPNLQRLLTLGTSAELLSPVPPMTPVGWSTILTGCNPGKHGVYDWWRPLEDYRLSPYDSTSLRVPSLFRLLADVGHTVGAFNIPLTTPAVPVKGFMIGGITHPARSDVLAPASVYPPGLEDLLREQFPDLLDGRVAAYQSASSDEELLDLWEAAEEVRRRALRHLTEVYQPTVLWIHCHAGDYFGHRLGSSSPLLLRAFRIVDETIGTVMDVCKGHGNILVVSDHGQTDITRFILIHNWLEREGLLRFLPDIPRDQFGRTVATVLSRLGIETARDELEETVLLLAGSYYQLPARSRAAIARRIDAFVPGASKGYGNIDWRHTRAFSPSFYGHICLNLQGRESYGIVTPDEYDDLVEHLVRGLESIEDPITRKPIGVIAHRRDDVYLGEAVRYAPDIVCSTSDPSYYFCPIYSLHLDQPQSVLPIDHAALARWYRFEDLNYRCDHTRSGIFVLAGPSVNASSRRDPIRAEDVAPTILALLGYRSPLHMDGVARRELLQVGLETEWPSHTENLHDGPSANPAPQQTDDVLADLRRIGYRL